MSVLTENLDSHPYAGEKEVTGKIRVKAVGSLWVDNYFNGNPDYDQIENVTQGKIYDVVRLEGYGDVESVTIIDDTGKEHTLADFFFEEVEE